MNIYVLFFLSILLFSGCINFEQRNEVAQLKGSYNYEFYKNHIEDYKLTTVAHWAHGKISDVLLSNPANPKQSDSQFLKEALWRLKNPSQTEPHQDYVAPEFARLAWRAIQVIDWTHKLHEQLYDIMADSKIAPDEKKYWIDRAVDYYLSEPDVAFSPAPFEEVVMKRVKLMRQPWFKSFRNHWPKTIELFWIFHWWHPVVYETQILFPGSEAQRKAILKVNELFFDKALLTPTNRMLLSREVMPRFSNLSPESANIFDNLHMFHGVVYDILASPKVEDKRKEIYKIIDLMVVRPGDRTLAQNFPTPHPEFDPLGYPLWLKKGSGEMGRIMGHAMNISHEVK